MNNQPATVAVLRQLAPELALIHAQAETLGSFDQAQQRMLLDRFAGFERRMRWRRRLRRGGDEGADWRSCRRRSRIGCGWLDLWSFQAKEIERRGLCAEDEDARLEAEKRVLANAEKLFTRRRMRRMSCCMRRRCRRRSLLGGGAEACGGSGEVR